MRVILHEESRHKKFNSSSIDVDQGIYGIGKFLPKTIVKVNWLFFINSYYVSQWRELTQNLKSCFPKNINNFKSISYQFCTLRNWPVSSPHYHTTTPGHYTNVSKVHWVVHKNNESEGLNNEFQVVRVLVECFLNLK